MARITSKEIEAFDFVFGRGLLAAARNELVQDHNDWPFRHISITSSELLRLLIQHGANPLERDVRGASLLHWAAGTGNLEAFRTLLPLFPNGILERTDRDGSTVLHWACAGADRKEFGTGGHYALCQYILSSTCCAQQRRQRPRDGDGDKDRSSSHQSRTTTTDTTTMTTTTSTSFSAKDIVNQRTKDGNSPLMWAAWSKSLDTVKLMIRHRAEPDRRNRNGCTVAHWGTGRRELSVLARIFVFVFKCIFFFFVCVRFFSWTHTNLSLSLSLSCSLSLSVCVFRFFHITVKPRAEAVLMFARI